MLTKLMIHVKCNIINKSKLWSVLSTESGKTDWYLLLKKWNWKVWRRHYKIRKKSLPHPPCIVRFPVVDCLSEWHTLRFQWLACMCEVQLCIHIQVYISQLISILWVFGDILYSFTGGESCLASMFLCAVNIIKF